MASYERFADAVRDPLVWLGQPDIADALAKHTAAADETDDHLVDVITAWGPALGITDHYLRDIIAAAHSSSDLQRALTAACDGVLSADKLVPWLRAHKDQWIEDGWRLTTDRRGKHGVKWKLASRVGAKPLEPMSHPGGGFSVIEDDQTTDLAADD